MNALPESPIPSVSDVAVIGLGPGGLTACIKAAEQGLSVTAFTNQPSYIRGQRIIPTQGTLDFFYSLNDESVEDTLFFTKFLQDDSIQIKDIESYLYRKLERYSGQITIIKTLEENPITSIQMDAIQNKPYTQHRDGTRYYFHHLIGADGHKRTISYLVKAGLDISIEYIDCPNQNRHPYHASVQLQVNTKKTVSPPPATNPRDLGWSFSYSPTSIIFTNKRETNESPSKYSFSGEIPEFIYHAPSTTQSELLKQWAILAISTHESDESLASQLDYRSSYNKKPHKKELRAITFGLKKSQSNQAYYNLPHGGVYAPIGDARRTPDYQISHGLNDAILTGIKVIQAIAAGDLCQYQISVASIDTCLDNNEIYEEKLMDEDEYDPSLVI